MTDTVAATPPPAAPDRSEDRTMPAVVYVLYLLGLTHGLTIIIGLVIAYSFMSGAGPKMHSHYLFQVRTVWTALAWLVIGLALLFVGIPLSFVIVGIPLVIVGWAILGLGWVWILLRCIVGIVYLARDEAHPRPRSWLL